MLHYCLWDFFQAVDTHSGVPVYEHRHDDYSLLAPGQQKLADTSGFQSYENVK